MATPPEYHTEWVSHYLHAGAHVLVEKPAVLTEKHFSLIQQAAHARQRAVFAGHVRRLFPSVDAARRAVVSGMIGHVRRAEVYEGVRWSWTTRSDFPLSSGAGGVLYDLGSHALDLVLYICGFDDLDRDRVELDILHIQKWPDREPSHELRAEVQLRMGPSVVPIRVQLSRRTSLANVVRVQGDKGEVLLSVWHSRTAILRENGVSRRLLGDSQSIHANTTLGCFIAEHLEMWRGWAIGDLESPLALGHFGLLTRLLETLGGGT